MKKIGLRLVHAFLIILIVLFSGCGLFKKVSKSKQKTSIQTSVQVATNTTDTTIDKSVITVKETVDTTVIIPEHVVTQDKFFNMDSLINGMTAIKSELVDISFIFNPATNNITTKATIHPVKVPVKIDKTTNIQKDVTKQYQKTKASQKTSKVESKSVTKTKEPVKMGVWLIAFGILIFVSAAVVYWWRNR